MWAILDAFARQVQVDLGNGKELIDASDWKDLMTASFRGEAGRWPGGRES